MEEDGKRVVMTLVKEEAEEVAPAMDEGTDYQEEAPMDIGGTDTGAPVVEEAQTEAPAEGY
ncbi:MAG: hypothetical protein GX606_06095 [Elusimicrobia bacterium]|nr:hypothetical protein [Elusimicrobiota bacterium]